MRAVSAARVGLFACHACGLLHRSTADTNASMCRRCSARLHPRKPDSVARTSALLISAYVLYIPANVLPVMETGSLFGAQTDTIMSGVVFLLVSGGLEERTLVVLELPYAELACCAVVKSGTCRHGREGALLR